MNQLLPRSLLGRIARGAGRRVHAWTDEFAVRRSLRSAGLRHARTIKSWTTPRELNALYGLALACPEGGQILEVGSHLGASTCYLTAGVAHRRGTVTCIDTWQNDAMPDGTQDTYEQFLKNVAPVRERLRLIRRPLQEVTPHDLGESFDLIFLDADHAYDATLREFRLAEQVINPAGIIAFHDSAEFEGVARAIGTILGNGQWVVAGAVENLLWIKRSPWSKPSG